ncbi:hypothetical protein [Vibrio vulnificus]|uniref:hypothetical protein n=1 Tax=Vibrio vulnificus TaxID=672 RepID=UPI0005044BD3|nr:hypothetical protein [Vibrio vulnificus]ASJ38444.1 hypothetical protein VVCECT4999_06985 [Vibrio vulnificus]EGR0642131.1 hypothetical protein [Vibrio vulnificus]EGR0651351.1 hypothetical protein [Vibrio vulnificus]EID4444532.1 hypothetical protein [Vibrio vulnificus]KGK68486.1 hypothetical protein NA76_20930 [Vibrio vulnificus]
MARSETIISVFVASPGDVSDERSALESIISELNRTWSRSLNLRLELVKWETDIHPGFGKYPQDVINQQLNDEYDIFIALFWSKVGSPTDVAESGTIEEFERAYQKYKIDPSSLDIMVYFKDQAIPPSKMDFVQLQKLQSLKGQMGEKGGLYWTFDSTEDFENLLRGHLSRVAQSWSKKLSVKEPPELIGGHQTVESLNDDSEDYGLFDYIDIYEDRMADMTSALELMSDATNKIGVQFNRRTAEVSRLTSANADGSYDQREARKIIKLTSDDLTRYSEILNSQVAIATSSRTEAFDALSKGISISIEVSGNEEGLDELKQNLREMLESAGTAKDGLSGFRESVASLPKLTIQINKAKRNVMASLDSVLDEIRKTIQSASDVLDTIQNIEKEKI